MLELRTRSLAALLACSLTAACVSPATQSAMDNTMNACIAGNDQACAAFPAWQAQANRETQESANVAGIILLPLVLFGAAIASGPGGDGGPYVYGHSEYGHYGYGHGGCCFGGFHGGGFYGHH